MDRLGRYQILRELGRGSRGQVYLARDPIIERDVVIKTLRTELAGNADEAKELLERFRREARALGQLKHASIVTVYDVAQDPATGIPYISMEYVPGADLQSVTRSGMSLPVGQIADIGAQVADTLHFAHQAGIIHRDIKPSNLLLGVDGMVRIADFGIVKIQGADITQAGLTLGTPSYMSPEQVRGAAIDGRSDIFALGVVLYEMLTGEKPFGSGSTADVSRRVLRDHPVNPTLRRARVPRDLSSFVMRCLEKDPAARWQDAGELAASLVAVATRERQEGEAETMVRVSVSNDADAAPTSQELLEGPLPLPPPEPGLAVAAASGGDFDAERWIADRELIRIEPIDVSGGAGGGRPALWMVVICAVAIATAVIVARGRASRALFRNDVAYVFGVSSDELEPAPRPNDIEKRLTVARRHMRAGRWEQAVAGLESLLVQRPDDQTIKGLLDQARRHRQP